MNYTQILSKAKLVGLSSGEVALAKDLVLNKCKDNSLFICEGLWATDKLMNKNIKVGDKLQIHCYKHNGKLHQVCNEAIVLDIDDEKIIVANYKAKLTESDGRSYHTPYIIDGNIIKYIDYDLDLRVFPDGGFKILDYNEYNYHRKLMNYPNDIQMIIKNELSNLIDIKRKNEGPFKPGVIEKYYEIYQKMQKNS